MPRLVYTLIPGLLTALCIFWVLQGMVIVKGRPVMSTKSFCNVDFVRLEKKQVLVKKKRVKPKKKEIEKKLLKPKVPVQKTPKMTKKVSVPDNIDIDIPLNLSANSALGDAYVSGMGGQAISTNVIPLSKMDPVYPRRAKMMRKEGYVTLEFTITGYGTVKDVVVVKAEPEGFFEHAAKAALLRWRFKAKADKALEQRAMVQINFRLNS